MTATTPDLLEAIVAATRRSVALRQARESLAAIEARALLRTAGGDRFQAALAREGGVNIIGECKRRSPSRGVLRPTYDPVTIAKAYQAAGACAVSILTEPTFFDGALDHLRDVREAVTIPLLRKDFIVDEYQLLEARATGADAVLLIAAALPDIDLRRLHQQAHKLGLAVLVEVHDLRELERAGAAGAQIIGVNNRNLRTLDVDLRASETIAARMPKNAIAVSESGLKSAEDLARMRTLGYRAFLIGERFMTADDPGVALRQLIEAVTA